MPSNGFSLELPIGKVSKVKDHHGDSIYSVDELGSFEGSFAIAHSKKELKQLMKSDADVVYDERKGKLYLNSNGEKKGWGNKKKSGLLANFKGKPELNAQNFEGLSAHKGDAITGDDIKDQITALSDELGDDKMSKIYGKTLINPKKGLKSIVKTGKKEGYKFDKKELGAALDDMNQAGAFNDVELDDAALATLMGQGGNQQASQLAGC
ncbi:hypothetical protein [Synechococcus sp. RS9902]|uniref:hypothetical protein n=1 Tax=Synechococcus sp. RS9902 TaxID=221345 RepID=UPI001645844E|nr:hypothetical protein [Synechococcus sp. RS9902]QNI98444.1 hypothetical protein SynRS9902_02573 [Synechococcus sp. RS9902]